MDTYDDHYECIKHVKINKTSTLAKNYNEKIRPAFASIIMAGESKAEAEFVTNATMRYAKNAKEAWDGVSRSYDDDEKTATTKGHITAIVHIRKGIKRKAIENEIDVGLLFREP